MDACCEQKAEGLTTLRRQHRNMLVTVLVINAAHDMFNTQVRAGSQQRVEVLGIRVWSDACCAGIERPNRFFRNIIVAGLKVGQGMDIPALRQVWV